MEVSMEDVEQCLYWLDNEDEFTFVLDYENDDVRQFGEGDDAEYYLLTITPGWGDLVYDADNWVPETLQSVLNNFIRIFREVYAQPEFTKFTIIWR